MFFRLFNTWSDHDVPDHSRLLTHSSQSEVRTYSGLTLMTISGLRTAQLRCKQPNGLGLKFV